MTRDPYVDSDAWIANSDLAKLVNESTPACITNKCRGHSSRCPTPEACLLPEGPQAKALRFFDRLARFLGWSK